jgi:hypothetical protein
MLYSLRTSTRNSTLLSKEPVAGLITVRPNAICIVSGTLNIIICGIWR